MGRLASGSRFNALCRVCEDILLRKSSAGARDVDSLSGACDLLLVSRSCPARVSNLYICNHLICL